MALPSRRRRSAGEAMHPAHEVDAREAVLLDLVEQHVQVLLPLLRVQVLLDELHHRGARVAVLGVALDQHPDEPVLRVLLPLPALLRLLALLGLQALLTLLGLLTGTSGGLVRHRVLLYWDAHSPTRPTGPRTACYAASAMIGAIGSPA